MTNNTFTVGKCPACGADVIKTVKGYSCINALGENPSCSFYVPSVISNRRISIEEIQKLLLYGRMLLDGFASKEMKIYTSILSISPSGQLDLNSNVCSCPRCGGNIYAGIKGFNCSNFSNADSPCEFVIWRNTSGHDMTLEEVEEICMKGMTDSEITFYGTDGSIYSKRLGLSHDKSKVIKI